MPNTMRPAAMSPHTNSAPSPSDQSAPDTVSAASEEARATDTELASLRVVFAGTPDFAVPALQALVAAGTQVVAVLTQPDRPAGRGKKLTASAVKQCAQSLALPVLQPESLKDDAVVDTLRSLQPDVMIVVAYGLLLPQSVLDLPAHGCLNIHGSLLPRWRGAAPIHRAVLAGDEQTGVTIMKMEAGLDTGPMIASQSIPITSDTTTALLHDALAQMGADTLVSVLAEWCAGRVSAREQDHSMATYAHKLEKQEASIDWHQSAVDIDRKVRGLNPWPVAESWCGEHRVRFFEGGVMPQANRNAAGGEAGQGVPGEVVSSSKEGICVQTGDGQYRISRLQWPGKRAMPASDFVNSRDITGLVFTPTANGV